MVPQRMLMCMGLVTLLAGISGKQLRGQELRVTLLSNPEVRMTSGVPIATPIRVRVTLGDKPFENVSAVLQLPEDADIRLSGETVKLDKDGVASFSDLTLWILQARRSVRAIIQVQSNQGNSNDARLAIVIVNPPASIDTLSRPLTVTPGALLGVPFQVRITNAFGDPIAQAPVTLRVMPGGLEVHEATDAAGIASFRAVPFEPAGGLAEVSIYPSEAANIRAIAQVLVVSGQADSLVVSGVPSTVRIGRRFSVDVKAWKSQGPATGVPVRLVLVEGDGRLYDTEDSRIGDAIRATDASGQATFGAATLVGKAGSYRLLAKGGGQERSFVVSLVPGDPSRVRILTSPGPRTLRDSVLTPTLRVRVEDEAGNPVTNAEVRISHCFKPFSDLKAGSREQCPDAGESPVSPVVPQAESPSSRENASVREVRGALTGQGLRTTNNDGVVEFPDLAISGPMGRYRLLVRSTGCTCADTSNPITYDPDAFLNRSYFIVSAIRTIAGTRPTGEFFDLRFRFRLSRVVFVHASTDLSLAFRGSDSVGSDQKALTDASLLVNFSWDNWSRKLTRDTDVPERTVFIGATARIFQAVPYVGFHVGAIELAGSPFHGSSLTAGLLTPVYRNAILFQGDTIRPQSPDMFFEFFVRSTLIKFFDRLTFRGGVLIPMAHSGRVATRIAIAVPLNDIDSFF